MAVPEKVVDLKPWALVEFPFFFGVRHVNGDWTHVIWRGSAEVLDMVRLGLRVELHDNGIEILERR